MAANEKDIIKAFLEGTNILDKTLSSYHCEPGVFENSVLAYCGGYCVTVPMKKDNDQKLSKCLRIWTRNIPDIKERSMLVSRALKKSQLSYFVDYEYLDQALKLADRTEPGIRMDWLDEPTITLQNFLFMGPTLLQLKKLAYNFYHMCLDMNKFGFAHGDLSSSNILVKPDISLSLIDYDSMYVPEMAGRGFKQQITGTDGFQHRSRHNRIIKANQKNDYFSQQIIYIQLLAFTIQPQLCKQIDDKALLFNKKDLESIRNFKSSPYYKILFAMKNADITFYLGELEKAINEDDLDKVKSLCDLTPPSMSHQSETPKPVDNKYRKENLGTLNTQPRVSEGSKKVNRIYKIEIPKSSASSAGKKGERCAFCNSIIANGYSDANYCSYCGAPRLMYKITGKV